MKGKLSPNTIALLDASRGLAAVYVVVHHIAQFREWTGIARIAFKFGQEAVIVFFLLSGFVIFANEYNRIESDLAGYAARRTRRIYPPLMIALALSTVVFYFNGTLAEHFDLRSLGGTLLGLQDIERLKPGVIVAPYLDNEPLWSLSYEIAFYVLFPAVLTLWNKNKWLTHAIGLVCCASYLGFAQFPNHWLLVAAYFQIWWTGAMIADAYLNGHRSIRAIMAPLLWLAAATLAAAGVTILGGDYQLYRYPLLQFRHFGFALFAVLVFFGPVGNIIGKLSARAARPATLLASISYGIYVFHYPLVVQANLVQTTSGLLGMALCLIAVSIMGDRQISLLIRRRRKTADANA